MSRGIRIIAGAHRGRRLTVPASVDVRPTADRVREALFSALGSVEGARVVDLFAGSGALGLEALSRGAAHCLFVETDRRAAAAVRKNVAALGLEDRAEVWPTDYRRALRRLEAAGTRCELLFLDPPYRMLPAVLEDVARPLTAVLAVEGTVVIEGPRSVTITETGVAQAGLDLVFERRYGDTVVSMLRKGADAT